MSSATRRIDDDSSSRGPESRVSRGVSRGHWAGVATVLAGALATVAATILPVLRVEVDGHVRPGLDRTGWDLHGPALLALALLAILLVPAAVRGTLAAAAGIVVAGLAVLGIAVLSDLPDIGDVGSVGRHLIDGTVTAGAGAYAEALAGMLLVLGGGLLVFLRDE